LLRHQGKAKAKKTEGDYKRALNHERIHSRKASSASEILQIARGAHASNAVLAASRREPLAPRRSFGKMPNDARKMRALPALTI
jgi:hypothetical protein